VDFEPLRECFLADPGALTVSAQVLTERSLERAFHAAKAAAPLLYSPQTYEYHRGKWREDPSSRATDPPQPRAPTLSPTRSHTGSDSEVAARSAERRQRVTLAIAQCGVTTSVFAPRRAQNGGFLSAASYSRTMTKVSTDVAASDDQAQLAILTLVLGSQPVEPWSLEELGRELGDEQAASDAVASLNAAGLVHLSGGLVTPTRAAARFTRLLGGI
jgi:hypothetical protein